MSEFIHFFPGQGFRPAVWAKDYIGPKIECILPVPTSDADVAMIGKFDAYAHLPPSEGYAWGTWIPASPTPQITAASLAGPLDAYSTPTRQPWHPSTPSQPWWPSEPNAPEWPCCIIITPPTEPELPQPAPVPVSASGVFLFTALAVLALLRRRK